MKKKLHTTEELSMLYDKINFEGQAEDFSDFSEHEIKEFRQIEKTVELLGKIGSLEINDKELFLKDTLKRCQRRGRIFVPAATKKKYFAPTAAAAAVILALFTFGVFNGPTHNSSEKTRIGASVDREGELIIVSEYETDMNKIENMVKENGGEIIERADGTITVQAKLSEYNAIKKEMTLSAEDKVFLENEKKLVTVGTDSKTNENSKFEDELVTFTVSAKK